MQPQKIVTSVRLDRALVERLDAVGEKIDRSRSWMTAAAISDFVTRHEQSQRNPVSNADDAARFDAIKAELAADVVADIAARLGPVEPALTSFIEIKARVAVEQILDAELARSSPVPSMRAA